VICGEGEISLTKLALNNFENNGINGDYCLENLKSESEQIEHAEQTDDRFRHGKKLLTVINKQQTIEDVNNAIELAYKYKIIYGGFFIFGLPSETKKDIQASIDFAVNQN